MRSRLLSLVIFLSVFSCREDEGIDAPLVGLWAGDKAEFRLNPSGIIPPFTVTEQDFLVHLHFKSDGSLILTDDKKETSEEGSYSLTGDQLTIDIDYKFEYLELSGTYNVELLTASILRASTEKEGTFHHPDSGLDFDGTVEATLHFTREAD